MAKFDKDYQQFLLGYESIIKLITSRLEIMQQEDKVNGWHTAIQSITSRIKDKESIAKKLQRKNLPLSLEVIERELNDIAGIRVVCSYLDDIYTVRDELLKDNFVTLIKEKDYIKNPKKNGYRSLHLIVSMPILFKNKTKEIKCEIQLRTTAMDSWASLEHQIRYKININDPRINAELLKCANLLAQSDLKMKKIAEKINVFK